MTIAVVSDTQPSVSQGVSEFSQFGAPYPKEPPVVYDPIPGDQGAQTEVFTADADTPGQSNLGNNAPDWLSAGYLEAEYTFYAIQTTYETDLGLQAGPATASRLGGDQNLIVRVRRPITFKIVNWIAQRLYVKPLLPHWNNGTDNEKLLKRTISVRNPLQSLNNKTWEASGQYVYAFKKEPYITVDSVEYFVIPAGKTTAENPKIPVTLHAYTQGDFSFVPLDACWVPVNAPLQGTNLPVGYAARIGLPDSPVPRQGGG